VVSAGLAILAVIIFLILRRGKKRRQQQPSNSPEASSHALAELPTEEEVKHEIYTREAALQELGRHSVYISPAKLPGPEVDLRGVHDS
jgi:hypothetical protein